MMQIMIDFIYNFFPAYCRFCNITVKVTGDLTFSVHMYESRAVCETLFTHSILSI